MFLESFVISHGYFDILHFSYPLQHLIQYFTIWGVFSIFYYIAPPLCFFSFLFMSKQHFDNDIKNMVGIIKYIDYEARFNKLTHIEFTIKSGSLLFLSTLVSKYNYDYWYNSLNLIGINPKYINIIINTFIVLIILEIAIIKKNAFEKIVGVSLLLLGQLLGPLYMVLYYMAFIHSPLSLYHTANHYFKNYCILLRYSLMIMIICAINIVNIFIWHFFVKNNIYIIEGYIPMIVVPLLQTHIILHNTQIF